MKIEARLLRRGKEIRPNDLVKILSDEVQAYIKDRLSDIPDVLLGMSAQPPVSPGVTSDRARKHPSSGGSSTDFDEINKIKGRRRRKRKAEDDD